MVWPSIWAMFCIRIFLSICRYFLLVLVFVESQVRGNRKRSRFGWMSATVNIWAMFWGQGGGFRVSESLRSLLPMRLATETSDDDILTHTCLASLQCIEGLNALSSSLPGHKYKEIESQFGSIICRHGTWHWGLRTKLIFLMCSLISVSWKKGHEVIGEDWI